MRGKRLIAGSATLMLACGALVGAAATRAAATDWPTVSVADLTAREGDAGIATMHLPVTLSAPSLTTVKVPYTVVAAPDGATDGTDARLFKGTVTFRAGIVSRYVNITSYGDTAIEPDQHVEVLLGTPIGNATIDKGVGLVTLTDDDSDPIPPSTITVSVGEVVIREGNSGTRTAWMPVLLSSPAVVQTKVGFEIDCSAAALLNSVSLKVQGTITFAIGQRSKFIQLSVLPDAKPEAIMQVFATITSKIASVKVLDNRGDATINDDDGSLPTNPGYPVPNFAQESLPTGSTFDAQAVGESELIDRTPTGELGSVESDLTGNSDHSQSTVSLSQDGRFAAFVSPQSDLVEGDTNGVPDVFVRDRDTGATERVSLRYDGTEIQPSDFPQPFGQPMFQSHAEWDVSISADGRYVAYNTYAALDPNDSAAPFAPWTSYSDIYLYDRALHTTELVSVDDAGNALHGETPTVSANGRYVLFSGGVGATSVYVRDRVAGTTTRIYNSAIFGFKDLALSANGRFAVIPSKGVGCFDQELVVVDLSDGSVERVDVTDDGEGGVQDNGFSAQYFNPVISGDGRFIAFKSSSWNLDPYEWGPTTLPGGPVNDMHLYVRDLALKSTSLVVTFNISVFARIAMSGDGNLVAEDGKLYDRTTGTYRLTGHNGIANGSLSGDGRYMSFVDYDPASIGGPITVTHAGVERVR